MTLGYLKNNVDICMYIYTYYVCIHTYVYVYIRILNAPRYNTMKEKDGYKLDTGIDSSITYMT